MRIFPAAAVEVEFFPRNGFCPPGPLKNPTVQTVLSSSGVRKASTVRLRRASQPRILQVDGGVKLLGLYSCPGHRKIEGIVVLLHGWEGSADSSYVLRMAQCLFDNGFAVLRLNFRDHGDSHDLNENIFFATFLDEVLGAVRQAARWFAHRPAYLVGFSLGGNFALRIARRCVRDPIVNLCRVVAVSPVLDPGKSTARVDRIDYVRRYFLYKWRRSLQRKQALYPDRFHFDELEHISTVRGLTDALLERYSHFDSTEAYFSGYNLCGDALRELAVPTLLLTADDDPIIPIEDFHRLSIASPAVVSMQRFGGHVGFLEDFRLRSWYESRIVTLFHRDRTRWCDLR